MTATPSASATATQTATPAGSPTDTATASPSSSATPSLTPSATATWTLTATVSDTQTPTPSPSLTQTVTLSATASPTVSETGSVPATRTPTPAVSPTATATPGLLAFTVLIYDEQGNLVANLGTFYTGGTVTGFTLSQGTFVPENGQPQVILTSTGYAVFFHGAGLNGQPLPNGYYTVEVQSKNGPLSQHSFYLNHTAWNGGNVIAVLPPRSSQAVILWSYNTPVNLKVGIYDLAGELVWKNYGTGQAGQMTWPTQSPSGQPVANGIYLMRCEADSQDGSLQDIRIIKLAVVR